MKSIGLKLKIYNIVKKIPKGKVATYGIIAKKVNISARAVGQILKRNPYKNVPCHRVVMSNGDIGGYRGKHTKEKIKILKREGIKIKNNKIQNFDGVLFYNDFFYSKEFFN